MNRFSIVDGALSADPAGDLVTFDDASRALSEANRGHAAELNSLKLAHANESQSVKQKAANLEHCVTQIRNAMNTALPDESAAKIAELKAQNAKLSALLNQL